MLSNGVMRERRDAQRSARERPALKSLLGANGYIVAEEGVSRLFDHHDVTAQSVHLYEPVFVARVIESGGHRILHCGDTLWHGGWWDIARAYGPFDVAFLPINGMQQEVGRYTEVSQPMSLTPEQAASAARILKPRLTIPIHYGSHGNPAYREEADAEARFQKAMAGAKLEARILKPGESFTI